MRYGLTQHTITKITDVLQQFPQIDNAVIYGSRVKGNFKSSSDIDITLQGKNIDLQVFGSLILKLDDLLLPNKFDLSVYHHITNLDLLDHIKRVGEVIYQNKETIPSI